MNDISQRTQPLRILSLDGGGVRGLSELVILDSIMNSLTFRLGHENPQQPPSKRPGDYFDLICGTSTGGLIALMLGRLGMTVTECLEAYTSLCKKVFKSSRILRSSTFDHKNLEEAVSSLLEKRGLNGDEPLVGPALCKTFVVAVAASGGGVAHLRSYSHDGRADECTIVEAIGATSAAPTFFDPITIRSPSKGTSMTFVDGGLGHNNPAMRALLEAGQIWPNAEVGVFLSIGTGSSDPPLYRTSLIGVRTKIAAAQFIRDRITECAEVHNQMLRGMPFNYFRFNVDHLGNIGLEEWTELETLNAVTLNYMDNRQDIQAAKKTFVSTLLQSINTSTVDETTARPSQLLEFDTALAEGKPTQVILEKLNEVVNFYEARNDPDRIYEARKRAYDFLHSLAGDIASTTQLADQISKSFNDRKLFREAAQWKVKVVEFLTGIGMLNEQVAQHWCHLAFYYLKTGEKEQARRYYDDFKRMSFDKNGKYLNDDVYSLQLRCILVGGFLEQYMAEEAEECLSSVLEAGNFILVQETALILAQRLANMFAVWRKWNKAKRYYNLVISKWRDVGEPENKQAVSCIAAVNQIEEEGNRDGEGDIRQTILNLVAGNEEA